MKIFLTACRDLIFVFPLCEDDFLRFSTTVNRLIVVVFRRGLYHHLPFGIFSAEAGPEGPDQKISGGSADDQMKFSFLAVFPPGSTEGAGGKTVRGDEPPMTACGGNFIGGEISRKGAISP